MDSYEATKLVFSRIKAIDPENASKIMGYLLIQDNGDKEMIRLAFGPETLLHNLIVKAKTHLSNASPSASATTPSSLSPSSAPWLPPASLSYANVVNGTSCSSTNAAASASESLYYSNISNHNSYASGDVIDEFHQFQDHLSFLDESSELAMNSASSTDADHHHHHHHNHHHLLKRSLSLPVPPNVCFGSDDDPNSGLGWKHCLYFAKGFCKNGTACKFHHIHSPEAAAAAAIVGSPSKLSEFELSQELLLRSKASVQQRKLAAASQFMGSFPYNNKCMNFFNDTQRSAALMMGDELHNKFGNCSRPERNDFFGSMNPSARQIYLTFPADSTFREEDVSNYFSIYGPVHDVRIPYQQKRMFGFVTFVYPETVKLILAKGNPHFVCDSRVLVKPYKEKGKVQEKKQQQHQQQMERGEYPSACSSPSGPFDFHFGGRMLYNNQEMLRRKLEEQADLQQAIEMQGRRLMHLQLHLKNNHHNHQFHHGLSNGSPIPSPTLSHSPNNRTRIFPLEGSDEEVPPEETGSNPVTDFQIADHLFHQEENPTSNHNKNDNSDGNDKEEKANSEENDLSDSLEHILPDNLFASPKKSAGGHITVFSPEVDEKNMSSITSTNNNTKLPSASLNIASLNIASLNTCFLQMSRFSSEQGTIGL